ncbi:MAG: flagellar protein FlaG [Clostridium beijerinckii]|jgi:flagellar protein FlaG|uniref:flagellar protein FlaG n=1 Tax=Clostridium beijerinckii TaxID=1520 RepID=UPI0014949246|nr:flagellar protein FlaG [Clostridium beijerinckii]MCI1477737.1 flagellar protein FlaG [Clostridium beijerinckii]MCI1577947.1 flagellar protein FlaG [Clostridium beijerinckii]MCI1583128.1 flagellar protein FlaG [Clostridium beijerinckii]MCI1620642.1 flagellar protein FlaG [Clostridium beijerinckii]NOW87879.1 flagellar protein FlaG [Clostridium beijerinckii]
MDVNLVGNNANLITKVYNTDTTYQYNTNNSNLENKIDTLETAETKKSETEDNEESKEKKDVYDKKELDKALKKLNKFLEDDRTHAEYSVHKDLGTIMIKVIDEDTNKVILEVPPKKILDMVASMCKEFGLIDKKA